MTRITSSIIDAICILFVSVLIMSIGGAMGSAVYFVSHHSIVGAIILSGAMLTVLIFAGYLLRLLSELLSSLVAVFVASPRGYDLLGSGRVMSRAMTVRMLSGLGTLIAVGAAIGVMVVR